MISSPNSSTTSSSSMTWKTRTSLSISPPALLSYNKGLTREEGYWFTGRSKILQTVLLLRALQHQQPEEQFFVLCGHTPHACVGLLGQSDASPSPNAVISGFHPNVSERSIAALRSVRTYTVWKNPHVALLPRHVWGLPPSRWKYIGDEGAQRHRLTLSIGKISITFACFMKRTSVLYCVFIHSTERSLHRNALVTHLIARAIILLSCLSIRHESVLQSHSLRFFFPCSATLTFLCAREASVPIHHNHH